MHAVQIVVADSGMPGMLPRTCLRDGLRWGAMGKDREAERANKRRLSAISSVVRPDSIDADAALLSPPQMAMGAA